MNLTAISGRPASAQSWDYDPTGNWRGYHAAANGTTTLDQHRVHDRGNRLTQIEGNPNNMILDRVGRMRQMAPEAGGDWEGKLEITWDAWSRITCVRNNGEVVGGYAYDGSHRRITREVDGETLHSYYNDAWRPVEERKDAETTAAMSYLWGARHRDDLVRRDRAVGGSALNETRYVLMDYFNPAAITDEAGEVKERYAFSAFGLRTIMNADYTARSDSGCDMEFAFQGQFLDGESGLMNYGYRYYSSSLGRWASKDPIEEAGGLNLYVLADNSPANFVDFLGLDKAQSATVHNMATLGAINALKASCANPKRNSRIKYCGSVCEKCSSDGSKRRFTTSLKPGADAICVTPQCPSGWTRVATFHSHPNNTGPSPGDRSLGNAVPGYVAWMPFGSDPNMIDICAEEGPYSKDWQQRINDDSRFDTRDKPVGPVSDKYQAEVPAGTQILII